MNRKSKVIVSIVGIIIVLLALLGLTYAYYLTRIEGNTNTNSISVTTADLKLVYRDGNGAVTKENIMPGTTIEKTFTVENTGNNKVDNYAVYLEEVKNTLNRTEDLTYVLECTSTKGTCKGESGEFPQLADYIVINSIEAGAIHTYKLSVTYVNLEDVNQSEDMGSEIGAFVQIYAMKDILDITGTVTNASEGDFAQINSVQKRSQIVGGKYKFAGVLPGIHTIKICGKADTNCTSPKLSQQIEVKVGTIAGVSGNTITMTESSQTANIDINVTSEIKLIIGTTIKEYSPFKEGTLAYKILDKAKTISGDDNKGKGFAMFREEPLTEVGRYISKVKSEPIVLDISSWLVGWGEKYSVPYIGIETSNCDSVGSYLYNGMAWDSSGDFYDEIVGCTDDGKPIVVNYGESEKSLTLTDDDDTEKTNSKSYYYRGAVKDNYVDFADMCWRIVRIEGDGNIKLILEDEDNTCASSNGNYNIKLSNNSTTGNFNYEHFINPSIADNYSAINAYKNFQSSFNQSELNKMVSGDWCLATGIDYSLKCNGVLLNDFKDDSIFPTPMYVSGITADEAIFAGGSDYKDNEDYYLVDSLISINFFWTMTTYNRSNINGGFMIFDNYIGDPSGKGRIFSSYSYGYGNENDTSFRPMIRLDKNVMWVRGDGTKGNPYIIG